MPELPEVETIKNDLLPWVKGHRFSQVAILDARIIARGSVEDFCQGLIGQTVTALDRRGKYLLFHLSDNKCLIIHLRMTGVLLLDSGNSGRYTRAVFHFSNGRRIVFNDRRRLGLMWLSNSADPTISKLGPEPLSEDFTPEMLSKRLANHQIPIKAALTDQSIIAGIGNMYADEALFGAGIHPLKRANSLSSTEIYTLFRWIQRTLQAAIQSQGASVNTYLRPDGQQGTAHFQFRVAHRGGEPCSVCSTPIERIEVRGRGTYFCPKCQRLG
jgi:formamidopyrimidine-DNA glycosylase